MIVESGPARILEVDRAGAITREIPLTVQSPSAHSDTRNARKTAAGTYLVAHEKDGVVREYDATGRVVWEFDVPLVGNEKKPGHGPKQPQILEITPDKRVVWSFRDFTTFGNSLPVAIVLDP